MKNLFLLILSLFIFSCDSGGGGDAITMDDLNGEWWGISLCVETVGECDLNDCEYPDDNFYIKVDNGNWIDCDTDDEPECETSDIETIELNGNSMTLCSIDPNCGQYSEEDCGIINPECSIYSEDICMWDNVNECGTGTVELDGDILQFIVPIEEEGCTGTYIYTLERKN